MSENELYERIDHIVLKQGNVFIRELLRSKNLGAGANKDQFEALLKKAIDSGKLTAKILDDWIDKVEGWGNQHIYPFEVPKAFAARANFGSENAAKKLIRNNGLTKFWDAPNSNLFPPKTELTRVFFDDDARALIFEWHMGVPGWVRDTSQDIERKEIEGDVYRFDAFRLQPGRIVTRFALLAPRDSRRALAALFVRQGVRTSDHAGAVQQAWADLGKVAVGSGNLGSIAGRAWQLSDLIKKVDSAVVNKNEAAGRYQVRATKLTHQRAAVQFTNTAPGALPPAVMDVRRTISKKALREDFEASAGEFGFNADPDRRSSRLTRVHLYPSKSRIRIGSELDREDVWDILLTLDGVR